MRGGCSPRITRFFTPPPELVIAETINGFMNMENVKTTKLPGLGLCRFVKGAKTTTNSAGAPANITENELPDADSCFVLPP